jgi:CheY-like chemotaxis protein
LRILLVEDNPANQTLAAYILQERGHVVDIAIDGRRGLCMTQETPYDVILMDVQMPGMDGLEATKTIRARENGRRRVPIIAMTAHAMKGDRERCLAAGMDGYLSKPIDAHETIALVESLAAATASAGAASTTSSPPRSISPPAAVFDPELALQRCLKKWSLLQEMIAYFFTDVDNFLPQIRAALQKGDLVEVGRLGHRLKGTVIHVGGEAAREAAERVEHFLLHAGEPAAAEEAVRALERECAVLRVVLTEYQATPSPMQGDP